MAWKAIVVMPRSQRPRWPHFGEAQLKGGKKPPK